MRPSRARTVTVTMAAALLPLLATACSTSLPTDATPRAGRPVDVQPRQDVQWFLPPPQPGAQPAEIVQGFLRANLGFGTDDANDVARTYLTPELASSWVPTSNVLVYRDSPTIVSAAGGQVTARVQVAGRIDADGHLTEEPAGTVTTQGFSLTTVDGEWRIRSFPSGFGLWLSRSDLERGFRSTTLFHLAPQGRVFVPEDRWLPRGDGLVTAVARAELQAPPAYLDGAVAPRPPAGLTVSSVPVATDTRVATVNLQGPRGAQEGTGARDLWAGLAHALLAVPGVSGVQVSLGGRPLAVEGLEPPATTATDLGYRDADRRAGLALLLVGRSLLPVDPSRYDLRDLTAADLTSVLGGPAPRLPQVDAEWQGLAATDDLTELAAVSRSQDRLWRWRNGQAYENRAIGDELTAPSFGRAGDLWVAGVSRTTGLPRVWVADGRSLTALARPVAAPWLADGERIQSLRVSPDGARVALVVGLGDGEGRRLVVCGVVRDSRGRAVALDAPLDVAPTLVDVAAARWATPTRLTAVGLRSGDSMRTAYEIPIGGWITPMPAQPGLVDLVPVPVGSSFRPVIRTDDGRFHTTEGSASWFDARNGDELVIPGS